MNNQPRTKTEYISRRSIWANIALCVLLSPFLGYIHTRRWGALFRFTFLLFGFTYLTLPPNVSSYEAFAHGRKYTFMATLVATVENGIAIKKAKQQLQNK